MSKLIPSNLMITDVSITNYHRSYSTEAMNGIRKGRDSGVQWFKGNITLQAYGHSNIRLLNGFLASLKGRLYEFALPLNGAYANPKLGRNPTFRVLNTAGSNSIDITHTSNLIGMGSVFTVPNETKLYTLLEDVGATGVYAITPALKREHTSPEVINFINPSITAVLNDNETTITHEGNGLLATATLSWREYLI
jgi:hypothetical protein